MSSLLYSCSNIRFVGKKSPKKYYQEFFIDNGIMQYFLKPVVYKSSKEKLLGDFTFRDTVAENGFVVFNYSIYTKSVVKNIDSAFIIISDNKIRIKNNERMFIDKDKNFFEIRYSAFITFYQMKQLSENESKINVFYNNSSVTFVPTKKTKSVLELFDQKVINIIELNRDFK